MLNDIITISGINNRYERFATYSNGDMTIKRISSSKRMFYDIKSDGRHFYNSFPERHTYLYSLRVNEPSNDNRKETKRFISKINDNEELLFRIEKDKRDI